MSLDPEPAVVTDPGVASALVAGYVLELCVHSGPHSDVYRVHPGGEGATGEEPAMAMKLAHARADRAGSGFEHCEIEHRVLARLSGPHAPQHVASIDLTGAPRLVMDFVEGRTLQAWLDEPGRPGTDEVLRFGVALARAVQSIHHQHVVHMDLQPTHVMVGSDDGVVLLGWGRAWHALLPDLLAGGNPDASPWVAPEPLLGLRGDPRSDVYAVGLLLYQLLTGQLPFGLSRGRLALRQRLWRKAPTLRRHNPAVTPWLDSVVRRCLEPEAARRYPSAAHLAFDLLHPQPLPVPQRGVAAWGQRVAGLWRGGVRAMGWGQAEAPAPLPGDPRVPLVLLAVSHHVLQDMPSESLRLAVRRTMGAHSFARLLCLVVLDSDLLAGTPVGPVGLIQGEAAQVQHIRTDAGSPARRWLSRLRLWARPFGQPGREAVCRVEEDEDPAWAILDVVERHFISEVVMLADDDAAQVVAREARCTVQLVRTSPGGMQD